LTNRVLKSNEKIQPRFVVALLGARMYWAVPRTLHAAGWLETYYTDFSSAKGWPKLFRLLPDAARPSAVRLLLGRAARGVPAAKTVSFNALGIEYAYRLRRCSNPTEVTKTYLWSGREFCRRILEKGFGNANAVFTYNSAGLEVLQSAKRRGLTTVMEQTIAPKRVERELLAEEVARFPQWEVDLEHDELADEYIQREEAEWQAADLILCGSQFVVDGIARCGGPTEKCVVVPYGVDVPKVDDKRPITAKRPLRVLVLGTIGLRKGAPYVLEAAKALAEKAEFRMVGGGAITPEAQAKLRQHLELIGPVPRSQIARHFEWADVFLLPSICEGSATVTYEALGHGLPVVCTPNTGSVIRDGKEGFLVRNRDVEMIVDRLRKFIDQPDLLYELGRNATARAQEFTAAAYGQRLLRTIAESFNNAQGSLCGLAARQEKS
jgi:glycosyltransferase involved in cell wall biosynthesis